MQPKDKIRLLHMLEASQEALSFLKGKTRENLDSDRQLVLAIIREVEIIGEAASKVSEETRTKNPQVPWLDIINMRHHLIHVYFDVDLNVVWDTAKNDLPNLVKLLEKTLSDSSSQ